MTPTPPEQDTLLLNELRWMVRLRWFAGLAVILGAGVDSLWLHLAERPGKSLLLGLVILGYNLPLWGILRHASIQVENNISLHTMAWLQLVLDLGCLTVLVLWTGGLSSPLLGIFVLHMVFAGILLPSVTSYVGAGLATVMLLGALALMGQWPTDWMILLIAPGWVATLFLTVFLTNHITRNLHRHDQALREQERHTRAILETAVDGIITLDEEGTVKSANPATERMFGYCESEIEEHSITVFMPEFELGRIQHERAMNEEYRRDELSRVGREVEGRHQDGTVFPVEISISETESTDRRSYTVIVRDITERKQSEIALRTLNEELKRQQQALVQNEKMAAMGQMAAGVAHEISNPLASMDGLLQLIDRHPERMKQDTVGVLREQVGRISRTIQQMTDFAHPNETQRETTPLNSVVEQSLDMVRFDHRIREVEVICELDPTVGEVSLMSQAVQQVLVNLILNALDAMTGIAHPTLRLSTKRSALWRIIELSDNGCGIPARNLDHIFEPFFTTKPLGKGTGLGLSISYTLIQQHGGRIEVTSEPGEGTRFTITLPVSGSGRGAGVSPKTGNG